MIDTVLVVLLWVAPWCLLPFVPRFRLKLLPNIVFFLCGISLALASIEIALRGGAFWSDFNWTPQPYFDLRDELSKTAKLEAAGHPLKFRDKQIHATKEPGKFRIAVLGDSFIYGTGLKDQDRWSRKLENRIQAVAPNVEVLHWGREAWSTQAMIVALKDHYRTWGIDLVVLSFNSNDPDMGDHPQWELGIGYGLPSDPFWPIHRVFPNAANFLGGHYRRYRESVDTRYGYSNWEAKLWTPENLTKYEAMLRQFHEYLLAEKLPCVVVLLPLTTAPYYEDRLKTAEAMFRNSGFDVLNVFPILQKRFDQIPPELVYAHRGDPHPGPGVTEVYAEAMAEYLLGGGLVRFGGR